MALPVIKYQPKRPGAGGVNDLPRSFAGNTPFGDVNAPKVGYQAPGATMNPAPKPRPPVGTAPFPGEPTDPRYVGPPQPNPVGDAVPKPFPPDSRYLGPPVSNNPPTPTTGNVRVSYNPSAPTNPTLGQGNGIVGNPMTGTPAPGPFPAMPEPTLPGGPVPPTPAPAPQPAFDRTGNTLQDRLNYLQGRQTAGLGGPNLGQRITDLTARIAGGAVNPKNYNPNPTPDVPPMEEPTSTATMKQGDLAELAPPVGYATFFRDQGKSAALKARKDAIKAKAGVVPTEKKKKKGGGGAPMEAAETPTNQAKAKKADKNKGLTDKQKRNLKKRPQPGTVQRPYINRGVTYSPVGFGGSLRV